MKCEDPSCDLCGPLRMPAGILSEFKEKGFPFLLRKEMVTTKCSRRFGDHSSESCICLETSANSSNRQPNFTKMRRSGAGCLVLSTQSQGPVQMTKPSPEPVATAERWVELRDCVQAPRLVPAVHTNERGRGSVLPPPGPAQRGLPV